MSTLQYVFLSLVMVTVALEAKKILRAQEGAPKTGRFVVKLSMDTSSERFNDLAKDIESEADDKKVYAKVDGKFAKIISAKLSEQALEMIKEKENVEYIEEETVPTKAVPWHLDRIDQRSLPLDNSFSHPQTGAGVNIYILDTGIRYTHNEFGGRALYPGYDPVDDETGSNQQGEDCDGHGTHVAGLAGGSTYGAAKDATLYSVRVLGCSGGGTWSGVIAGINSAASDISNSGPGIISMSLGGGYIQAVNDAVEEAVAAGVHVSVAAGNEDDDACSYSPASAPSAVTVGATDINDDRAWFSNFGTCVDIFAPGASIESASVDCDSCTDVFSGTSMACPITTGVMATILEANPGLSPAALTEKLVGGATTGVVNDPGAGSPNKLLYTIDEAVDENWPEGPYALPKPESGCPNVVRLTGEGYIFQDNEDDRNINSASSPLSLAGSFGRNTKIHYCVYEAGGAAWPSGSYCVAMYNNVCPSEFVSGYVYWDDEDDRNINSRSGSYPSGSYGRNTRIYYCCRSDGSSASSITLPTGEPFYLYRYGDSCQQVSGMTVRTDWRFTDDEDYRNANSVSGCYPSAAGGRNHRIYFCYYY